jgi:hypothetical protein
MPRERETARAHAAGQLEESFFSCQPASTINGDESRTKQLARWAQLVTRNKFGRVAAAGRYGWPRSSGRVKSVGAEKAGVQSGGGSRHHRNYSSQNGGAKKNPADNSCQADKMHEN